jgi:hypothetical protein
MPPKRKQNGGNRMNRNLEELKVRQVDIIGNDLMLCLDELAYITISGSTES